MRQLIKIKSHNLKKLANLLEQLLFTYSTNRKIEILATYLKSLNYKEKGITIAVLTGTIDFCLESFASELQLQMKRIEFQKWRVIT